MSRPTLFKLSLLFFWLLAFLFGLQKINLSSADLGRHLTNGRLLLEQKQLINNNFYSYTMPEQPVVTHHWLSGIIFYLVFQLVGFKGLSYFYAGLMATAFSLIWVMATNFQKTKPKNWWPLIILSIFLLPLYGLRTEIRPEGFSLLLLALELWLLLKIKSRSWRQWWWLPIFALLQILWVNLHLFFVFSWILVGAAWLASWFGSNQSQQTHFWFKLLLTVVATSLINPFFIKGWVEPFLILQDFGYSLAENQTLFFMIKRFNQLKYWHSLLATTVGLGLGLKLSWLSWSRRKKGREDGSWLLFFGLLLISFSGIAFFINRLIPFLALLILGLGGSISLQWKPKLVSQQVIASLASFFSLFLLLLFLSRINTYLSPFGAKFGVGLLPQAEAAAQFFKKQNLNGPIFNNYDLGGYLIYELYPQEKVFVDNRPEAYNPDFFQTYISAQEDETAWQKLLTRHQFQTIFFYRHDQTPWAQPFLIKRLKNPAWIPVYVDDLSLILVRNNEVNKKVIEDQRLPKEMFRVK